MRTLLLVPLVTAACASSAASSYGVTRAEYRGGITVTFTNASSQKVCDLRMVFDGTRGFGDNWLPPRGLASGDSIQLAVKPGTYKATWSTCRTDHGFVAGTLTRDMAIELGQDTQLYAYVAERVAPTTYAAVSTDTPVIRFQGQPVAPTGGALATDRPQRRQEDAFARVERELALSVNPRAAVR